MVKIFHCELNFISNLQASRTGDESFKMGGLSPSGAGASHHSAMTPQLAKSKEKLSDALKSCNEILKELFSKKHSVSFIIRVKYFYLDLTNPVNIIFFDRDMHGRSINLLMLSYLGSMTISILSKNLWT